MGKIYSVGVGPGELQLITPQAKKAFENADAILGHNRIIHHIKPLIDGKAIYSSGHNKESDLIKKAFELAQDGKNVAVISRGDSGIYGLAVILQQMLPENADVEFELIPGIPEFLCASSLVGTPLADGFAVLSLSTRLTPKANVLFRSRMLAQTDMSTVLHFPAEKDSQALLQEVIDTFAKHRPPDTLITMINKPYRKNQEIVIDSLESFLIEQVVDVCTIIICSEDCHHVEGKIQGKRGYIY